MGDGGPASLEFVHLPGSEDQLARSTPARRPELQVTSRSL